MEWEEAKFVTFNVKHVENMTRVEQRLKTEAYWIGAVYSESTI